jgi:hypothetical protein
MFLLQVAFSYVCVLNFVFRFQYQDMLQHMVPRQHILEHMAILGQHMLHTLIQMLMSLIRFVDRLCNCSLNCF